MKYSAANTPITVRPSLPKVKYATTDATSTSTPYLTLKPPTAAPQSAQPRKQNAATITTRHTRTHAAIQCFHKATTVAGSRL